MSFFKYLFLIAISLLSFQVYAQCEAGIEKSLQVPGSIINSPQQYVCNNSCRYKLNSCVHVEHEGPNGTCLATSTGERCGGTNPDPLPDPETELTCSVDTCLNPNNLKCPSGYVGGFVNNQRVCTKSSSPDPDPPCDPATDESCTGEPSNQEIIAAIDDAKYSIADSIYDMTDILRNSLIDINNSLAQIADKLQNIGSGTGGENGEGGDGYVDTSGFDADVPMRELEQKTLKENLFPSSAQCPPDNTLSMNVFGTTFTYNFSYQQICNPLYNIGYLVMIFAYLYAAYIVVKS